LPKQRISTVHLELLWCFSPLSCFGPQTFCCLRCKQTRHLKAICASNDISEFSSSTSFTFFQDDIGLQRALVRTRLLKRRAREEDFGAKIAAEIAAAPVDDEAINGTTGAEFIGTFADDAASNRQIILNETSEFCRHLGAWRASETTGMGETVSKEILDFESSLKAPAVQSRRGRWEEVSPTTTTAAVEGGVRRGGPTVGACPAFCCFVFTPLFFFS